MSMNFGREQALLRQRLTAKGSPALADARQLELGNRLAFLGASDDEVQAAANDLAATYPEMGRAQMTAFVRTLWQSKIHELRAVGAELLAQRAGLLEPADLPFLEQLLQADSLDGVARRLATDVLGFLVDRHRKLWKDLRRLAATNNDKLRRAAVRSAALPLAGDDQAFPRFVELVEPLLGTADAGLLEALDEVLTRVVTCHSDAVQEFAARHGRKVRVPKPRKAKVVPPTPEAATPRPATQKAAAKRPVASKKTPAAAAKTTARRKDTRAD